MSNREQVVLNGRYELQRRVGRGGMAEVFLARDRLLDRPVAIKILFPEFATDPSFVARFRREAQSAANLNHPNIVGVYDWGKERGTYYIVMEYVDGRTVSDIIRADGPLEAKRAAGIAADVAAALGFAHRKGVVHRDVKPGNVLITGSGEVKVADFGIARAMTTSSEENLTQTGSVMGTATYFSPEQAQGKPVDPRSDLYSLGVVLYEMASGKPPFSADSPVAIAYKHVQEPVPPLHDKVPGVPRGYEAITNKALAKDPDRRYQDAAELRADLLRFRDGRPVQAGSAALAAGAGAVAGAAAASALQPAPTAVPGSADRPAAPEEAYEHKSRSGWFFAAIVVLLAILGALIFAFGRQLGVFDDTVVQVAVIDVVDSPVGLATQRLEALDFEVVVEREASDEPVDQVLAQDPEVGERVDRGSTVTLTVSSGPATGEFPDVVDTEVGEAERRIRAEKFTAEIAIETQVSDIAAPGTVVRQSPSAGPQPLGVPIVLTVAIPDTSTTTEAPTTTAAPTTTLPPTTTTLPPTTTTLPTTTTTLPTSSTTVVQP